MPGHQLGTGGHVKMPGHQLGTGGHIRMPGHQLSTDGHIRMPGHQLGTSSGGFINPDQGCHVAKPLARGLRPFTSHALAWLLLGLLCTCSAPVASSSTNPGVGQGAGRARTDMDQEASSASIRAMHEALLRNLQESDGLSDAVTNPEIMDRPPPRALYSSPLASYRPPRKNGPPTPHTPPQPPGPQVPPTYATFEPPSRIFSGELNDMKYYEGSITMGEAIDLLDGAFLEGMRTQISGGILGADMSYDALINLTVQALLDESFLELCDPWFQQLALIYFFVETNGIFWINHTGWLEDTVSTFRNLLTERPPEYRTDCTVFINSTFSVSGLHRHCCWFGVACCLFERCPEDNVRPGYIDPALCGCRVGLVTVVDLSWNNVSGYLVPNINGSALEGFYLTMNCSLQRLVLQSNYLIGNLPPHFGNLSILEVLGLGNNMLTGTIPKDFGHLQRLKELDLSNNNLTGEVPPQLCENFLLPGGAVMSDLLLANNRLVGPLSSDVCRALVYYDAKGNTLTGTLPSFDNFPVLHILQISNNSIKGTLPESIHHARLLTDADLSYNQITGTIPLDVANLMYLTDLKLGFNFITGTIPPGIFTQMNQLSRLLVPGCMLNGTLPNTIGNAAQLLTLDLSSNKLTGTLPDSLSKLGKTNINILDNALSCCGVGFVNMTQWGPWFEYYDESLPLLPPGISFSTQFRLPQSKNPSNRWAVEGINDVDDRKIGAGRIMCPALTYSSAPVGGGISLLPWSIDPSYYMYKNCTCMDGYDLVNDSKSSHVLHYTCTQRTTSSGGSNNTAWIVAVSVISVLMMILVVACLLLNQRGGKHFFVKALINFRKRFKGRPVSGPIAVVVAQIEGYRALMIERPEEMREVMLLHQAAVRKSKWANFGYSVNMEEDSYSLVFHDALDAVKFCVQFQTQLMETNWPLWINGGAVPSLATRAAWPGSQQTGKTGGGTAIFSRFLGSQTKKSALFTDHGSSDFEAACSHAGGASASTDPEGGMNPASTTTTHSPGSFASGSAHASLGNGFASANGLLAGHSGHGANTASRSSPINPPGQQQGTHHPTQQQVPDSAYQDQQSLTPLPALLHNRASHPTHGRSGHGANTASRSSPITPPGQQQGTHHPTQQQMPDSAYQDQQSLPPLPANMHNGASHTPNGGTHTPFTNTSHSPPHSAASNQQQEHTSASNQQQQQTSAGNQQQQISGRQQQQQQQCSASTQEQQPQHSAAANFSTSPEKVSRAQWQPIKLHPAGRPSRMPATSNLGRARSDHHLPAHDAIPSASMHTLPRTTAPSLHMLPRTTATSHNLPSTTAASHKLPSTTATSHNLPSTTAARQNLPSTTAASHKLPSTTAASHKLPSTTAASHNLPSSLGMRNALMNGEYSKDSRPAGSSRLASHSNGSSQLFSGLTVRMGVSTGYLERGSLVQDGAVMEHAIMVCSISNGGQILLEQRTFERIKDSMEDVGTAGDTEQNKHRSLWSRCARVFRRGQRSQNEAVLLDMGKYVHCPSEVFEGVLLKSPGSTLMDSQVPVPNQDLKPGSIPKGPQVSDPNQDHTQGPLQGCDLSGGLSPEWRVPFCNLMSMRLPSVALQADNSGEPKPDGDCEDGESKPSAKGASQCLTSLLPGGGKSRNPPKLTHLFTMKMFTNMIRAHVDNSKDTQKLSLYQVLPPTLVGRAKLFGSQLMLGRDWVMLDRPYFYAPGALESPLGPFDSSLLGPLPAMTMVFCMVDGGKLYAARHRKDARAVHKECANIILGTLQHFQDGYLVRQQDGDLKYMVAFESAEAALLWCLVAQEALMYADWPSSALEYWQEETLLQADRRGQTHETLLFRGPRMKMGLCEGTPRSILPDHLGRADYFGNSINMSARYMDAGAHGGQVVCELALAQRIASSWQAEHSEWEDPLNCNELDCLSTDSTLVVGMRSSMTTHCSPQHANLTPRPSAHSFFRLRSPLDSLRTGSSPVATGGVRQAHKHSTQSFIQAGVLLVGDQSMKSADPGIQTLRDQSSHGLHVPSGLSSPFRTSPSHMSVKARGARHSPGKIHSPTMMHSMQRGSEPRTSNPMSPLPRRQMSELHVVEDSRSSKRRSPKRILKMFRSKQERTTPKKMSLSQRGPVSADHQSASSSSPQVHVQRPRDPLNDVISDGHQNSHDVPSPSKPPPPVAAEHRLRNSVQGAGPMEGGAGGTCGQGPPGVSMEVAAVGEGTRRSSASSPFGLLTGAIGEAVERVEEARSVAEGAVEGQSTHPLQGWLNGEFRGPEQTATAAAGATATTAGLRGGRANSTFGEICEADADSVESVDQLGTDCSETLERVESGQEVAEGVGSVSQLCTDCSETLERVEDGQAVAEGVGSVSLVGADCSETLERVEGGQEVAEGVESVSQLGTDCSETLERVEDGQAVGEGVGSVSLVGADCSETLERVEGGQAVAEGVESVSLVGTDCSETPERVEGGQAVAEGVESVVQLGTDCSETLERVEVGQAVAVGVESGTTEAGCPGGPRSSEPHGLRSDLAQAGSQLPPPTAFREPPATCLNLKHTRHPNNSLESILATGSAVGSPSSIAYDKSSKADESGTLGDRMSMTSHSGDHLTGISLLQLGTFKFKGAATPVQLISVVQDSLLQRRFPADPPKGKGNRLSAMTGTFLRAPGQLGNVTALYKKHFDRMNDPGEIVDRISEDYEFEKSTGSQLGLGRSSGPLAS